jgi:hypothetical protein
MANEITVVGVNGRKVSVLFLFPIATPATDYNSNPVVPTPATSLSSEIQSLLDTAEITALNNGTMYAQINSDISAPAGLSQAQVLAKARAHYARKLAEFQAEYAAKYNFQDFVGQRFDSV